MIPLLELMNRLKKALDKLRGRSEYYRQRYGDLSTAPQEFLDEVLPKLTEAVDDPAYALRVANRAWQGIVNNESSYTQHHGGAS